MKTITKSIFVFSSFILILLVLSCSKSDTVTPSGGTTTTTTTTTTKSSEKDIKSFVFYTVNATISGTAITATLPVGVDASGLVPTITVSDKATVSPNTGVVQNFSKPVTYTVTAEDGTTKAYTVAVTVTLADYQIAINAKFVALGWDKDGHNPDNGNNAIKTKGGKGYVQYYSFNGKKTAIYYFADKGAFAMDTNEMTKYDALGQDTFAYVVSDPKASGAGSYNDIIKISDNTTGIIITYYALGTFVLYGDIYKKYLALNRWDGPLGYPLSDESTSAAGNRVNGFTKGVIYYATTTGAQAIWGKIYTMHHSAGDDNGWLKLPTASCDPNLSEQAQSVAFQNGYIDNSAGCGKFYRGGIAITGTIAYIVNADGSKPANGTQVLCY